MTVSQPLTIGFLGSGEIAVPILAALSTAPGIELRFVNTQPDRPAGRKQRLVATPVGNYAERRGLNLTKYNVNSEVFHILLETEQPAMVVVVDFGQILRMPVLEFPKFGCINIHASLLPKYRGASPIQSAIINRDGCTGVTFMQMEAGLDTGPVFHKIRWPFDSETRADELLHQLGELAAVYAADVLKRIAFGGLKAEPQCEGEMCICKKIKKSHGEVNWHLPANTLVAQARGYHPWPGLWFMLQTPKKNCRICITEVLALPLCGEPSEILNAGKNRWVVACGEGSIEILRLIPEGKPEMHAADFLRGTPLPTGLRLELTPKTHEYA